MTTPPTLVALEPNENL
jgi:hypothetical protein